MQISNISNFISPFAGSLRKAYHDTFKDRQGLSSLGSGTYSIVSNTLNFQPDPKESVPTRNFVAVDRKMPEKYSARIDVSVTSFSRVDKRRVSMVANYVDEDNYLVFSYNSNNHEAEVVRYEDGRKTILGVKKLQKDPGREFKMQLDKNHLKHDFYIEGEKVFSVQDTAARGSKDTAFGFGSLDAQVAFSNLEIYQ